jgi:plasmid replication initiation protein
MRHRTRNEREQLELFQALPGDLAPRDAQDLMAYPFFSLAKTHRTTPIDFRMNEIAIRVETAPEHGMATIWDADVLIWAASQIVEARDAGLRTARLMATTPREILTFTRRGTGARDYHRLKAALNRLPATTVATSLRQTTEPRMHRFLWINGWTERADAHGNDDGIDLIMPDGFYRAVLDDALVLTIGPAYFGLTAGLERWLYRRVHKHASRQRAVGGSIFATSTSSRRAFRRSSASHSSCGISHAASACRATGLPSRARPADGNCWRSRPHRYPQEPVDNLCNHTCYREPTGTCHQEPEARFY